MPPVENVPPNVVRRAAAIARGPHACPSCEAPTWAEPPVPWVELRDYLVRCDACERPLAVRIDRERILRRGSAPRHLAQVPGMYDPVAELLDSRGRRAFARRVGAALLAPLAVALPVLLAGGGAELALLLASTVILPGALWAPCAVATAWSGVRDAFRDARLRLHRRRPQQAATIEVDAGRWDQWMREERRRERERFEHPEAVLRELERVLDDRELRRVRALAEHGDVPAAHLDDLLSFRRSWTATVA